MVLILSLILMLTEPVASAKDVLSLSRYLNQVRQQNDGVKGARETSQGAFQHSDDGDFQFRLQLYGSAHDTYDARPTLVPLFQGTLTTSQNYSLGLQKNEEFGLQSRLHYDVDNTNVQGAAPSFLTTPQYYDSRPVLELTQPLWNNGFGRLFRAQRDQTEATTLSRAYRESYQYKVLLSTAEQSYWRLALTRKIREVQQISYDRAIVIRSWSERRTKLQLADRSDFLQAEAALGLHSLDLRSADDDVRAASRDLNTNRGQTGEEVSEELEDFDELFQRKLEAPTPKKVRDDVLAAEQDARVSGAMAQISREANLPNFDLNGMLATYGRDPGLTNSMSNSFSFANPYWTVGLRLVVPLDVPAVLRSRTGWAREQAGSDMIAKRTQFEAEQQWTDLTKKLGDAQKRLALANTLEKIQKEKLAHERMRLERGRTTLYQVLSFEQDYQQVQLTRINAQALILQMIAQMKQFQ